MDLIIGNLKKNKEYFFEKDVFKKVFSDKDYHKPCDVVLISLPRKGYFIYDGNIVKSKNFSFPSENSDKLSFVRITDQAITEDINFVLSDRVQNKLYSNMATLSIRINAYVNQKPTSVGNKSMTTNHGEVITFTPANFTTETTPLYSDPEGDAASKLKVLSLPNSGTLKLNGVSVNINQEIDFSDIALGRFKFFNNPAATAQTDTSFNFAIADAGSGLFTS